MTIEAELVELTFSEGLKISPYVLVTVELQDGQVGVSRLRSCARFPGGRHLELQAPPNLSRPI